MMDKLAQFFQEKIAFMFDETRMLPNYGQLNPTFIAMPRKQDTYQKIESVLKGIKGDFTVESFQASGNAHSIRFEGDSRIVIIYAKDKEDFEWLYRYHSYSNSMIFGRILKSAGFKLSEDGLEWQQFNLRKNHKSVIGSILITKDFGKILELLKLDKQEFENGFKTVDEVLSFFLKTPFLNPQKFINKEKEQRSILLQKFEEYLILNKIKDENSETLTFEMVKEFFTEIPFESLMSALLDRAEKKQNMHEKLNGRVILDSIPGFEPKQIGAALSYFKHSFGSHEEYENFLIESSQEEVMAKFKELNQVA